MILWLTFFVASAIHSSQNHLFSCFILKRILLCWRPEAERRCNSHQMWKCYLWRENKICFFFFSFFSKSGSVQEQILLSFITSKKSVCVVDPGSIATPFCSVHCESGIYWTTCHISECLRSVDLPVEACILHSVHTIYFSTLCASPLSVHRLGIHM